VLFRAGSLSCSCASWFKSRSACSSRAHQLGQGPDAQAVALRIQAADVEQHRRQAGGARAGDVHVIQIADVHVVAASAPERSSAIWKKRGWVSRRPRCDESKTTSNDEVKPSRSKARCSVPLAFGHTTRRSPAGAKGGGATPDLVRDRFPQIVRLMVRVQFGDARGGAWLSGIPASVSTRSK